MSLIIARSKKHMKEEFKTEVENHDDLFQINDFTLNSTFEVFVNSLEKVFQYSSVLTYIFRKWTLAKTNEQIEEESMKLQS